MHCFPLASVCPHAPLGSVLGHGKCVSPYTTSPWQVRVFYTPLFAIHTCRKCVSPCTIRWSSNSLQMRAPLHHFLESISGVRVPMHHSPKIFLFCGSRKAYSFPSILLPNSHLPLPPLSLVVYSVKSATRSSARQQLPMCQDLLHPIRGRNQILSLAVAPHRHPLPATAAHVFKGMDFT